jgi:tetratricopeptide (TPR) repeat protein
VLAVGLVAGLVYANAVRNGWAQDDVGVIEKNPAAQSVTAALGAWFTPYWPDEGEGTAGLYRPAVILSYGIDWATSAGRPWWFHLMNVLLHAVAAALVVRIALAWLAPTGALAAGLLFAVHPVHVEAVANVVGRADILAAIGVLGAVLAARRYRGADSYTQRGIWFGVTVVLVALGLLSKEHAAVAVVVLALDHWLAPVPQRTRMAPLYMGVLGLTLGWFYLWQAVAGGSVAPTVASALRGLEPWQRLATAVPVQLEVLRLLTWPITLAASYDPQVIPQRLEWTWLATLAAVTSGALVALAFASVRRAPVVAFGIIAGLASIAPASNLLFASGITLAERTLFLAVLAPALAAGWAVTRVQGTRWQRVVGVTFVGLLVSFAVRTFTRTPFWRDSRTVVIEDYLEHPENFRAHVRVGRTFEQLGETRDALREYLWAAELFDRDPFVAVHTVRASLALGNPELAIREARRAWDLMPRNAALAGLVIDGYRTLGRLDSALAVAQAAVERAPRSLRAARQYRGLLAELAAPSWRQHLAEARVETIQGRFVAATEALAAVREALTVATSYGGFCGEVRQSRDLIWALDPALGRRAEDVARREELECAGELWPRGGS